VLHHPHREDSGMTRKAFGVRRLQSVFPLRLSRPLALSKLPVAKAESHLALGSRGCRAASTT
jgi:hypothetical protein